MFPIIFANVKIFLIDGFEFATVVLEIRVGDAVAIKVYTTSLGNRNGTPFSVSPFERNFVIRFAKRKTEFRFASGVPFCKPETEFRFAKWV